MAGGLPDLGDVNQLFYSNFEDSTDRAQWASVPSGWSDAYATAPAPLYDSFSARSTTTATAWLSAVDLNNTASAVIYARVAFRTSNPSSGTGSKVSLQLADASGTKIARVTLRWDATGSTWYRIYAEDTATDTLTAPGSPVATLNDATYFLELVYTRGTSVIGRLRDASNNIVTGYSVTRTTAESATVDEVGVQLNSTSTTPIWDAVEVRLDDTWTTP
jgi:hypothetical protein